MSSRVIDMAVEDPHGDIKIDSAVGELEFSKQ